MRHSRTRFKVIKGCGHDIKHIKTVAEIDFGLVTK